LTFFFFFFFTLTSLGPYYLITGSFIIQLPLIATQILIELADAVSGSLRDCGIKKEEEISAFSVKKPQLRLLKKIYGRKSLKKQQHWTVSDEAARMLMKTHSI